MFCPECGSQVASGNAYCSNCGKAQNNLQSENSNSTSPGIFISQQSTRRAKSSGGIITAVLVICVLLLAGVGIYFTMNWKKPAQVVDTPGQVVYKLCEAVNRQDFEKAMTFIDPKYKILYDLGNKFGRDGSSSESGLLELFPMDRIKNDLGASLPRLTVKSIDSEQVQGDQAVVKATISIQDRKSSSSVNQKVTMQMQKFGSSGTWKITNLELNS